MKHLTRMLVMTFVMVLTLGFLAPVQARSHDNGRRIAVGGEVTTVDPTSGDPCLGGTGSIQRSNLEGVIEPFGLLVTQDSTVEFCAVYKQSGTLPAWAGGVEGSRVILVRDGVKRLTFADGSLTFAVSGKVTFSDKPEELDLATTTVSAKETWVVTGGTDAYAGAVGSIRARGEVPVLEFLMGALTVQLSGGIVIH